MLYFNKSFIRKVHVGRDYYNIEQNGVDQSIIITRKKTNKVIYIYKDGVATYDPRDAQLIKLLFHEAHIERYVM
jgi:hypothetical protein